MKSVFHGFGLMALALLLPLAVYAAGPGSTVRPDVVSGNTNEPSYSAAVQSLANVGAGDLMCITGAAGHIISLKDIRVSAIASAGAALSIGVVMRSTPNTGGTVAATPFGVPSDPLNDPSVATLTAWTVSPTPGTLVGIMRTEKLGVGTPGNTVVHDTAFFTFGDHWNQAVHLRDANHSICLNLPVAFGAGASIDIDWEWTETP